MAGVVVAVELVVLAVLGEDAVELVDVVGRWVGILVAEQPEQRRS